MINQQNRKDFEKNGFIIFKNVIDKKLIYKLRLFSDEVLSFQEDEHYRDNVTTGSMIMIDWLMVERYKVLEDLIAHHNIVKELSDIGFEKPKFGHGRIISKPPRSPRLFWHEDGRFWDDPVSYTKQPIQCFIMYYLTDTTPQNGCLRVIPGSHRKRHKLHDIAVERHNTELLSYSNPDDIQFQDAEGEIDVCLSAGDAVMGYANLFHAAHANQSDAKRTVLALWYYPDFVNLPDRTQATIYSLEHQEQPESFFPPSNKIYDKFRVNYIGNSKIIDQQWVPGKNLR